MMFLFFMDLSEYIFFTLKPEIDKNIFSAWNFMALNFYFYFPKQRKHYLNITMIDKKKMEKFFRIHPFLFYLLNF